MAHHDENLPPPVKWHRRIIILLFSPAIAHWLFELVAKLIEQIHAHGQPPNWKELVELDKFAVSLTLSGILVLAYLCYYLSQLRHLPNLFVKLNALTALQEQVRVSGVEAVAAATRLIDRVLGTTLDGKTLSENHADAYNQSIEALGFKFACWFEPVKQNQTRNRSEMVGTWLRYSRTYNFEEAFDIKRREIATNARNFTYMLLATLDSLATHCREQNTKCGSKRYKVMHVAVTPVHPKDWFNWPHGAGPKQAYFEEDFITHFWRCLREIKDAPANKDVMTLKRYILSATDNDAQKAAEQKLRRRLKTAQKIKETLRDAWILPVSTPLEKINDQAVQANAKDALVTYYRGIIQQAGYVPKGVSVIPLVCKQWDETDTVLKNSLESLKKADATPNEIVGLSTFCKQLHTEEITIRVGELDTLTSAFSERVKEAWKECKSDFEQLLAGSCASLHKLIVNCHKLDVRLCEHTNVEQIYPVQETLRSLVAAALRFDDCLHHEQ